MKFQSQYDGMKWLKMKKFNYGQSKFIFIGIKKQTEALISHTALFRTLLYS